MPLARRPARGAMQGRLRLVARASVFLVLMGGDAATEEPAPSQQPTEPPGCEAALERSCGLLACGPSTTRLRDGKCVPRQCKPAQCQLCVNNVLGRYPSAKRKITAGMFCDQPLRFSPVDVFGAVQTIPELSTLAQALVNATMVNGNQHSFPCRNQSKCPQCLGPGNCSQTVAGTLSLSGSMFTLLAPDNNAFDNAPYIADAMLGFARRIRSAEFFAYNTDMLYYHVLPGKYIFDEPGHIGAVCQEVYTNPWGVPQFQYSCQVEGSRTAVVSLQGAAVTMQPIVIEKQKASTLIFGRTDKPNAARVTKSVQVNNGVIHIISEVLVPPLDALKFPACCMAEPMQRLPGCCLEPELRPVPRCLMKPGQEASGERCTHHAAACSFFRSIYLRGQWF